MKIAIDCRMLDESGVGVYIRECLPYFLDTPHTFLLLGDAKKLEPICGGQKNVEIIPCPINPFSFNELVAFPRAILHKINHSDSYYSPYFNFPAGIKIPVYTTIHDIVFPDMPELTSRIGLAARMWFYRRAYRKSKSIFTVSEFSKSRIQHHLAQNRFLQKKIIVTYSAVQHFFLPDSSSEIPAKEIRKTDGIDKKNYILFIGNIKKHKGLSCLVEAFFRAHTGGIPHKLVIVGRKDNFRTQDSELLAKLAHQDDSLIEFTGNISNSELKKLLSEAALLVQPSLYEGFGLPPLEAMLCGTRALISDIPVFKEIYADFPVTFFEAGNADDLHDKLMQLLYAGNIKKDGKTESETETVQLSAELIGRYTFEKTASIILREILC